MAPQGPTHGKGKLASRIGPAGWPAHSGGTRGDCARTGGSGLCRRQLRNRRMSSDGAGVGGELGAGAAGDGDGADDDGEEGGPPFRRGSSGQRAEWAALHGQQVGVAVRVGLSVAFGTVGVRRYWAVLHGELVAHNTADRLS